MAGETNLALLIKNMQPKLHPGEFVFCSVRENITLDGIKIVASFFEEEGKTLVLKKETADQLKLSYENPMAWITLNVHSSLEAVGLTAKVSTALADKNISCNIIAAYYHDHIFVSKKNAQRALETLIELTES